MSGAIQTNIGKMPKGFKGQISNSNPATTINGSAIADVRVGVAVAYSGEGFEVLSSENKASIAGVSVKTAITDGETITKGKNVTVAKKAPIYVFCETACNRGAKVYARHTTDGDLLAGDFRNDIAVDKAVEINATFAESLTGAGLVEINLDL